MFTGISQLSDLNAQALNGTAISYDLSKLNDILLRDLANYNDQLNTMLGEYCYTTTNQSIVFDVSNDMKMVEVDQFAEGRTQMSTGRFYTAFPLRKFLVTVGWDWQWFQMATLGEVNKKFLGAQMAHMKNVIRQMKVAFYTKDNYSWIDVNGNGETLTCRAAGWNADSSTIPTNYSSASFVGSSHTHYLGVTSGSAPVVGDFDNLVTALTEHDQTAGIQICISNTDLATVQGLSKFTSLSSDRINYSGANSTKDTLDVYDVSNRVVGLWRDSYPVVVRPWSIAGYALAVASGMPDKPLGRRISDKPAMQGLRVNGSNPDFPIITQDFSCFEGFAGLNRSATAVLYYAGTNYVNPTIV
jgi:hypothetical protein